MLLSHLPNLPVTPGPCPSTVPWNPTIPVLILHGAANVSTCMLNRRPSLHPPRLSLQSAALATLHSATVQTTFCLSQTITSPKDNSLLRITCCSHSVRTVGRAIQKPRTSNLMAGRWLYFPFVRIRFRFLSSFLERTKKCLASSSETRVLPFRLDASISATREMGRARKERKNKEEAVISFAAPAAIINQLDGARNNNLRWKKGSVCDRSVPIQLSSSCDPQPHLSLLLSLPPSLSSTVFPSSVLFKTLLFPSSFSHHWQIFAFSPL